jgi:hypothetical protein
MTTNDASRPRMNLPDIRDARIHLRIAELRVLAAKTAIEFWREKPQPSPQQQLLERMRRGDGQRRNLP